MCAGLCVLGKAGGVGVCTKYKVIQNYRLQKYKSYKKFQNTWNTEDLNYLYTHVK